MATKDTLYKYHATVTMPSGKTRHLFTNDTVSRTKVLIKSGIDMGAVNWIALEQPMTKAQVQAGATPVASDSAEAVA